MRPAAFWTLLVCFALFAAMLKFSRTPTSDRPAVVYAAVPPAACQFPTKPAATPEETAWQMFTAANCPWQQGNGAMQAVWESWPTQEDVFTSGAQVQAPSGAHALAAVRSAGPPRFHTSFLQRALAKKTVSAHALVGGLNTGCGPATAPPHRVLCEEVRLNPSAAAYVTSNSLTTHAGQGTFVAAGKTVDFPSTAVEVKADWLPNCKNPRLHVETIGNTSYCLIAMHIISKVVPQWEWGTWEAKDDAATPNRCVSIGCQDSFGSSPEVIPAGPKANILRDRAVQTAALQQLEQNGGLTAEWANYSLNSAQDSFVTAAGTPIMSGNSITEEEIPGTPMKQSSCMTCHAYSAVNSKGLDSITTLKETIGQPVPLPAGYAARDVVWAFLTAPPPPPPPPLTKPPPNH
jgi:hypothetical protein